MNANDVLIDVLEDNRRRLLRAVEVMPGELLGWRPEPGANSILVTIWHMARILDVFLNRQALGQAPDGECWFKNGWAVRTRYDPRGLGLDGFGMLTGYSREDVEAMPALNKDLVLGYLNEVYDTVNLYLAATPFDTLQVTAPGFDGKYSLYQCIQMAMLDNVRHLGEIFAIKSSWERKSVLPG